MSKTKISKENGAVRIAQEALIALKTNKIKACSNAWLESASGQSDVFDRRKDNNKDLKDVLLNKKGCRTCAIGGLFAAAVMLYDKMPVKDIKAFPDSSRSVLMSHKAFDFIKKYLSPFFDDYTLTLIEYAFEGGDGCVNSFTDVLSQADLEIAYNFYSQFSDHTDIFKAIMENIIRNEGKFKLEHRIY